MKSTTVGIRYAKALLDLAIEQNCLNRVNDDMNLLNRFLKSSKDLVLLINSPVVKADKKQAILKEVFAASISELTLKFIYLLCAKRREHYLDVIAEQFNRLYNQHRGIQTAIVTTAVGLDDEMRKKVYELVRNSSQSEIELVEKVDQNLIGGFVIRIGDNQLDSSVVRSLNNFKRKLIESK